MTENKFTTGVTSTTDVDKLLSSVNKRDDKKEDALMTTHLNLESYLAPAPNAIALLGNLILISTGKEFSLQRTDPNEAIEFKHVSIPSSFRATLIQISNTGWTAFNKAHRNMNKIGLHATNIESHVNCAVKFLMQGSNEEVQEIVPPALKSIQEIAAACQVLAKDIESGFEDVICLIDEVQLGCASSKGEYETKQNDAEKQTKEMERKKKDSNAKLENMKIMKELAAKEIEKAKASLEKEITNLPSNTKLFGLAICDGFKDAFRFWSGAFFGSRTETIQRERTTGTTGSDGSKPLVLGHSFDINTRIDVLVKVLTEDGDQNSANVKTAHDEGATTIKLSFENIKSKLENNSKCSDQKSMLTICDDAIGICSLLKEMEDNFDIPDKTKRVAEALETAKDLQNRSRQMCARASKMLGNSTLNDKSPHQVKSSTTSTNPSLVTNAIENARYRIDIATETLKESKQDQDKRAEEIRQETEKITEILIKMDRLDLEKIDFDEIRKVLKDGIEVLGSVKQQWAALVVFFQDMADRIDLCLKCIVDEFAKKADSYKSIISKGNVAGTLRDTILQDASDANKTAYVTRCIATTYVDVSNKHIMTQLAALGRLVAYDPKEDKDKIDRERKKLKDDCAKATKEIQSIMEDRKERLKKQIDARIACIDEMALKLPKIDPCTIQEIKETVQAGFSNQEIEDY